MCFVSIFASRPHPHEIVRRHRGETCLARLPAPPLGRGALDAGVIISGSRPCPALSHPQEILFLEAPSQMRIETDRALIPASVESVRYLTVNVTAPDSARRADRPAVNVALVLDRSGSMDGRKLDMARKAVAHAIRLLDTRDHLAVVVYDNEIDVILESTTASPEAQALALKRLAGIGARG